MTDEHPDARPGDKQGELHDSPLPPAEDERIRRLLSEARHTEPMPAEVAARLDGVLAGLNAEREEQLAPVVELASRRRRTAASLLVAAAAVVVLGVGLGQVLPDRMGGNDAGSTADTVQEAEAPAAGGGEAAPESGRNSDAAPSPESSMTDKPVVHIRSAHFGADVRRARTVEPQDGTSGFAAAPSAVCPTRDLDDAALGKGQVLAATYDDAPAMLVLRPPAGEVQVVDLYLCGDTEPRRSITLTTP